MGRPKRQLTPIEQQFTAHLKAEGLGSASVRSHVSIVRAFLKHVGSTPLDRISAGAASSTLDGRYALSAEANR